MVNQPVTRGASELDSQSLAVVVCTDDNPVARSASTTRRTYRPVTPNQHANFLKYVSTAHLYDTSSESDTQTQFDKFYSTTLSLLNQFYPEKTV